MWVLGGRGQLHSKEGTAPAWLSLITPNDQSSISRGRIMNFILLIKTEMLIVSACVFYPSAFVPGVSPAFRSKLRPTLAHACAAEDTLIAIADAVSEEVDLMDPLELAAARVQRAAAKVCPTSIRPVAQDCVSSLYLGAMHFTPLTGLPMAAVW